MENVVWVSVVSLTPKEWSVLMVGDDGRWHSNRLTFESSILDEGGHISAMKGCGESWFRVPWKPDGGLVELARAIGDVVSSRYPSARYLQLAIEPRLARLPWNDLFRPIWRKLAVAPVIAIVPNFTWALVANRMDHQHGVQLLAADEESLTGAAAGTDEITAGFFRRVREQLFSSRTLLKQIYSSGVFVLARGAWNPDTKMTDVSALEGTIALKHEKYTDLLDLGIIEL
jgi:hypothetical protein